MNWTHVVTDPATVTAGGQASVNLLQNMQFDSGSSSFSGLEDVLSRGATITRILGNLWIRPGDADSETEGTFGIHMVEADAEAASAIPDPLSDTTAKWMHWQRFLLGTQATDELGRGEYHLFQLDIKAQRKMQKRGDALNLILENDDGTHTFTFALGLRVLIKR